MEGHRFFDLKRWNKLEDLNLYINGIGGGSEKARRPFFATADAVTARHYNFPIPNTQVQLSSVDGTARTPQNTGW